MDSMSDTEKKGFVNRLLETFTSRKEAAAPDHIRSTVSSLLYPGGEWGPGATGRSDAADAAQNNIVVSRAVALIASTLAAVPICVLDGEEKVEKGPLVDLLANPNELEAWPRFCRSVTNMSLIDGQSFILLSDVKNSFRLPTSMIPLASIDVEPNRPGDALYMLNSWDVEGHGTVEPDRVLRIEYMPDPSDPLGAISPLTAAASDIESDEYAAEFNRNSLESGGAVAGVLQWKNPDIRLPQEDLDRAAGAFERKYSGRDNANSTAVLSGDWDYSNLGNSARDLEYIAGREFVARRLALIYGIPPVLLGDYSTTGLSSAGLETARRFLYENAILPIARNMQAVLTKSLCKDTDQKIVFDFSGIEALREDYTEKLAHAEGLMKVGYPVNIINEQVGLGMPEIGWGDDHLVNAGLVPAAAVSGDAGLPAEDPTEAATDPEPLLNEHDTATLLSLVEKVQSGALPRDSAKAMMIQLLGLTPEQAEQFLGSAGTQTETVAEEDQSAEEVRSAPENFTSTPTRELETAIITRMRRMK